jgi:DNA-binding Lrp family transcriptional regulator
VPERNSAEDLWAAIDGEILDCLACHGTMTPAELGGKLGLREGETTALLAMLAREGKIRICQVELNGAREPVSRK